MYKITISLSYFKDTFSLLSPGLRPIPETGETTEYKWSELLFIMRLCS